ncbi:hypothetical protein LPJ61_006817, partial [Coemansia biformis]
LLRSEVVLLRKIGDKLKEHKKLDGLYPRLEAGGWVHRGLGDNQVLDSTREMISGLSDEQQRDTPFCLHVRYAMTPIGKPLRDVKSVPELIIVLFDVMRCYMAINNECEILHRDISNNNIMIVRTTTGRIHGLLIDFDCALDTSLEGRAVRPERTGTLPFMSVANLEELGIKQTALDDWESLLYLVCWLGTFGINSSNDHPGNIKKLRIHEWHDGDPVDIASKKRGLAQALHRKLFMNNKLVSKCHGALKIKPGAGNDDDNHVTIGSRNYDDVFGEPIPQESSTSGNPRTTIQPSAPPTDPFIERAKYVDKISDDLIDILRQYAIKALAFI